MKKRSMLILTLIAGTAMLSACGTNVTTEISEQAEQIASEASSEADKIQQEASEAASSAEDKVSEAMDKANEAADQASEAAEQAKKEADELMNDFQNSTTGDMDLSGSWQDEISQRATMDVTKNADGSYDILVHWGASAMDAAVWEIHGTYDAESGMLSYEDGKFSLHSFTEDGTETISDETTTSGSFTKEGDKLRWKDSENDTEGLFSK